MLKPRTGIINNREIDREIDRNIDGEIGWEKEKTFLNFFL